MMFFTETMANTIAATSKNPAYATVRRAASRTHASSMYDVLLYGRSGINETPLHEEFAISDANLTKNIR